MERKKRENETFKRAQLNNYFNEKVQILRDSI